MELDGKSVDGPCPGGLVQKCLGAFKRGRHDLAHGPSFPFEVYSAPKAPTLPPPPGNGPGVRSVGMNLDRSFL